MSDCYICSQTWRWIIENGGAGFVAIINGCTCLLGITSSGNGSTIFSHSGLPGGRIEVLEKHLDETPRSSFPQIGKIVSVAQFLRLKLH